jgi:ATP-binding cassette subfamily F protein 3
MVSINHISLSFGERTLLNDISFLINPRDRIGLVGNNGAGKTTLLKIISGLQSPDSGTVQKPAGLTIGYLPQQMRHIDSKSLFNEVKTAFSQVLELENKIHKLNLEIEKRNDYHSGEYIKLISQVSDMSSRMEMLGATKIDEQIEKTLFGLGFTIDDLPRQTLEFSGGWRMRIELAKILLQHPDLLLLDEPTNHLDIESIQWFEGFLSDYAGAIVLISHDRAFLNNVTKRTIEISLGRVHDYRVSYSKYVILRKEHIGQQLAAYKNQQKAIADTKEFIERFRYKATKAVQVQSRIKALEKTEIIEVDEEDLSSIHIKFPPAPRSGGIVIEAAGLSKKYGDKLVLDNIDLVVSRGERIAFVGKNGEGKTTLARIITNGLEHTGKLQVGHKVKTGYFAQNQDELLDENITVLETIDRIAIGDIRLKIRSLLGAFLFRDDDIDKKVKVLSGGERSRLALIKLLLEPFNLLVLDEPTNHLDMRSKDILKKALADFTGTLILVSHDREFLEGLADKIYEFKAHKITLYDGDINYFLEKKKIDSLRQIEVSVKDTAGKTEKKAGTENKSMRKITGKISSCENEIDRLENELLELSKQMETPSALSLDPTDHSIFIRYGQKKDALDLKMREWEKMNHELSELRQKQQL